MFQRNLTAFIAVAILSATLPASASESSGYYRDTQKGWWWGERTVEEEQEKKPEQKKQQQARPKEEKEGPWVPPPLGTYEYSDVWNMHPDDFYEFQEAYKKKAVQDPSEENTRDYYELSEIARKKSAAFTNASQYVWQKYPELSVAKDYPVTTPGNLSRVGSISNERKTVLQQNRDKYALIYFWKPGCSYCDEQGNILKWFQNQSGWIVKPVNIEENPALAMKIGVEMTPTLILIRSGSQEHMPVSAGVVSADELEEKLYRAIRLLNTDMTPQEYSIYEFQKGGGFDVNSRKDWVKEKETGRKKR